ncbi:helix-turn-helix transcriptional regulator [Streptomyces sp. NPDC050803]|uniref:helix-turn-helix domain-containing protein n=1 Tax=unclassified Streptomyces TaxID=2593676 RepID=UPI003415C600
MNTPHSPEERDVKAAIETLRDQAAGMGGSLEELINFERITHLTAIPEATVRRLFAGEDVSEAELNPSFTERLRFLHETRRRPDGAKYRISEIAEGAQVSKEAVNKMLNGTRKAGLDVGAALERFFGVAPGYFTMRGSDALLAALAEIAESLNYLALLKGGRVEHLALRGSLTAGDDRLARELRQALQNALESERAEDPEIREITATVRALPAGRRTSVLGIIRNVLGLAGSDGNSP